MTTIMNICGENVEFDNVNYDGHVFSDFYVRDCHSAPGFFVFGRNAQKYGVNSDGVGMYTMLCARPHVKPRKYKNWNGAVRRGWLRKRDAQKVADALNAMRKGNADDATHHHCQRVRPLGHD